ncbi:MAG: GNAT family N-acetyltransferase [Bacteroidia bacterium]|nr:GNAT family N-acetyltransferase [Bacteroidia bacterium]
MEIKIRKGEEKDIARALELVRELAHYEKCPDEVEVTTEEMSNWGFGAHKVFDFFVGEANGKIEGIALYYYKYSTWKGKCIFLEDIIVTEKMRGKGIGKLLFEEILKVATEEKVRRLEWQVLDWNKPAINFYEKYKANFDGEWINCKLTNKDLNSI